MRYIWHQTILKDKINVYHQVWTDVGDDTHDIITFYEQTKKKLKALILNKFTTKNWQLHQCEILLFFLIHGKFKFKITRYITKLKFYYLHQQWENKKSFWFSTNSVKLTKNEGCRWRTLNVNVSTNHFLSWNFNAFREHLSSSNKEVF